MSTEDMRASLITMARARGITATVNPMAGPDPAVIIGNIAVVMEPGCYQVFKYVRGFLDAIGDPHQQFASAASFALDQLQDAA